MKKNISKKNSAAKKQVKQIAKPEIRAKEAKQPCTSSWSASVYIYWFIILFFIAATFYILGRSHGSFVDTQPTQNVEITEEALLQPSDYYESGKTKLLAGNIDEAITDLTVLEDFNTAIEKDPVNAIAYYDRALLNIRLEDYATALNDINNALAAQTANPTQILQLRDLYAKRGQLNLWLKNWEGAIADYTNSLSRPDGIVSPSVYAERAEAYTALNNYTEAINDYTSAIRVISEQIQGATTAEQRESLSSSAMSYFEKSAALNLALNNIDAARSDLESAYTIAAALTDTASMERLQGLINDLQQ